MPGTSIVVLFRESAFAAVIRVGASEVFARSGVKPKIGHAGPSAWGWVVVGGGEDDGEVAVLSSVLPPL